MLPWKPVYLYASVMSSQLVAATSLVGMLCRLVALTLLVIILCRFETQDASTKSATSSLSDCEQHVVARD